MIVFLATLASLVFAPAAIATGGDAVPTKFADGFEKGLSRWADLWTRDPDTGTISLSRAHPHKGAIAAMIEHTGEKDWSFHPAKAHGAEAGDIYELECWFKVKGRGRASICVTARDRAGEVVDWTYAERTISRTNGWHRVRSTFVVPVNVATVLPRVIGNGPATVLVDDFSFKKMGTVESMRSGNIEEITVENAILRVTANSPDGTLRVADLRSGRTWSQKVFTPDVTVTAIKKHGRSIRMRLLQMTTGLEVAGTLSLEPRKPEFVLELTARGDMPSPLRYPHPFTTAPGERLIIPMNEGISYPVDDATIKPQRHHTYGGHGLCMSFYGSDSGGPSWMAIIETPDDAAIRIDRVDGNLTIAHEWRSQKGKFGYRRRLRYIFFDRGGYVAIAKRYRRHARDAGLLKTLKEKQRRNPDVDLLIGAVNVWNWDFYGQDAVKLVKEMRSLGIERILWSHRQPPETIEALNMIPGVLTSRYDIYQDVMDPALIARDLFPWTHPDWTHEAWPRDLMIDRHDDRIQGWGVDAKDGKRYFCGVLCDRQAPDYARRRITEELKTHPYRSRFIDTTTATEWRECYHKEHPVTRTESKRYKMELLKVVSEEMGLVCGSETGHDAAVPYVHYFEGMLSLGPYRVREAGRDMGKVLSEVPEQVSKFQVGEFYRIPLWELVYHDCVVAQWYWGDYNNKLPKIWKKRDLFNVLYGTPPMFMFTREGWKKNKARFANSYRAICPTVRKVGYSEMIDHRILTPDRTVQETEFANGITVTVNFGDKLFTTANRGKIASMSYRIREK